MSRVEQIELDDQLSAFVAGRVADGGYGSVSEVVRAGLRLLQDREAEHHEAREDLDRLKQAWGEGIASGDAGEIDFSAIRAAALKRLPGASTG